MSQDQYLGNPLLKKSNVKFNYTKEQIEEYIKCAEDVEYFILNYCYIETLDHGLVKFSLYDCQKKKIKVINDNRKVIIMEGRQQGKCVKNSSFINIRNKKTGEMKRVTIEEFHEMLKLQSNNKES